MIIIRPQPNPPLQRTLVGLIMTGSMLSGVCAVGLRAAAAPAIAAPVNASAPSASRGLLAQGITVIERGSTGELVSELQRRLSQLGYYDGPVTGFFGELTETAVIRFQQDQGLAGDGIVGDSTADALRDSGSASDDGLLQDGATGPRVTQLQEQLTTLGFYEGPITGFFGELTEAAVIRFQAARGLTADGIVGASTEAALSETGEQSSNETERVPDPTDGLLERGEVGEAVTDLQRRLTALGYYDGPIDGRYGPRTEAAVSRFQTENALTSDGVAGPATIAAVDSAPRSSETAQASAAQPSAAQEVSATRPASPAPAQTEVVPIQPAGPIVPTETAIVLPVRVELAPGDIRTIQARLQDRGFYNGPVDGVLNDATRRAIATAQQAYEVSPGDLVFSE